MKCFFHHILVCSNSRNCGIPKWWSPTALVAVSLVVSASNLSDKIMKSINIGEQDAKMLKVHCVAKSQSIFC